MDNSIFILTLAPESQSQLGSKKKFAKRALSAACKAYCVSQLFKKKKREKKDE